MSISAFKIRRAALGVTSGLALFASGLTSPIEALSAWNHAILTASSYHVEGPSRAGRRLLIRRAHRPNDVANQDNRRLAVAGATLAVCVNVQVHLNDLRNNKAYHQCLRIARCWRVTIASTQVDELLGAVDNGDPGFLGVRIRNECAGCEKAAAVIVQRGERKRLDSVDFIA
jgi:hypothetical protein